MAASSAPARADGLITIDPPSGGHIVGPLTNATSLQAAVVAVLRYVHSRFQDRPQVGKLIPARDNHSIAAVFAVNDKAGSGGSPNPICGVFIVSMPDGSPPAAAVVYDDASRFRKTGAGLVQQLLDAWHTASAVDPDAASAIETSDPGMLVMMSGGDHSAGIALPPSWRLTGVGAGKLTAEGPNGEQIARGVLIHNINDRVTPRSGDLFESFVAVTNRDRQHGGLPIATYQLVQSNNASPSKLEARAITAAFVVDFQDGKGPRNGTARIAAIYPRGVLAWEMSLDATTAPTAVANRETALLAAINTSFTQNADIIRGESERANAKKQQKNVDHQKWFAEHMKQLDANARAFDKHMDNIDRYSKSFQNYIFDRSQLQDNDDNTHGTISRDAGDALVKADPERFQIVQQQDFVKGVDY